MPAACPSPPLDWGRDGDSRLGIEAVVAGVERRGPCTSAVRIHGDARVSPTDYVPLGAPSLFGRHKFSATCRAIGARRP